VENKYTKEIENFEKEIFDNYFDFSKEDSFLTHYTSFNGLEGILKSKSLWFTYYKYLNDESEGKIIYEVLDSVLDECETIDNDEFKENIKEVIPANSNESPLRRFLNGKKDTKVQDDKRVFLCSFSKNDDCLPMWNYYTKNKDSKGFNLVFRRNDLIKQINGNQDITFDECKVFKVIYNSNEQKEIISELLIKYYKLWQVCIKKEEKSFVIECFQRFLDEIRFLFKHEAFQHEEEIRILLTISNENYMKAIKNKKAKARENNGLWIPYLEISCISEDTIECIRISPTEKSKLVEQSLHELLLVNEISTRVFSSSIPLRY
jgi:hypothetical protein